MLLPGFTDEDTLLLPVSGDVGYCAATCLCDMRYSTVLLPFFSDMEHSGAIFLY
jgi:hypothetical protein